MGLELVTHALLMKSTVHRSISGAVGELTFLMAIKKATISRSLI